jgi:hypothetical protein
MLRALRLCELDRRQGSLACAGTGPGRVAQDALAAMEALDALEAL